MTQQTLYVFPHNYYSCRSRHGLLSALPSETIEQVVATLLAALDDATIAEDWIQLLLVAPALAELGYGEVVDAPDGVDATAIDLFWTWEQRAIDIAHKEPDRVQQVFKALSLGDARNLADVAVLRKYMPDVIAAYQPKAEFSEFVWELLGGFPPASDSPWHLDRAGRGVALCCHVPHETCPSDFDPWVSLDGNKLLAQIAERWPELKPEQISHEFPHYQGRYFRVGPDLMTVMILLGKGWRKTTTMSNRDFKDWKDQAIIYAKGQTASEDVAWLVGEDATMRELGFNEDLDPSEYVDNCLADAAA